MGVTSYYSFGGEILGEETGGVRRDYLTDALGSVTATVTGAGVVENTYRYKPYGEQLAKTGTGSDPKFLWNGKWGYQFLINKYLYVRNRAYGIFLGLWTTRDPYILATKVTSDYLYSYNNPVNLFDYSGKNPEVWIPRKPVDGDVLSRLKLKCAFDNPNGITDCDIATGRPVSVLCKTIFDYQCGASNCLQSHEHQHRQDLGPCCGLVKMCIDNSKKSNAKYTKKDCLDAYTKWNNEFLPFTECNAFVRGEEYCSHLDLSNQCCNDDKIFCAGQTSFKNENCKKIAGKPKPSCPFTKDGGIVKK